MNYQKQLELILKQVENKRPSLLLHSCCAPCSSYVLEYLLPYFEITVFYFNPNITDQEEYRKRVVEQKRLISELSNSIHFLEGPYDPDLFYQMSKRLEPEPEGGARCIKCYYMRLEETAKMAQKMKFDYFTTTLTVSPYKKSAKINLLGSFLEKKYQVAYLYSDFKKNNGYKRSIELSHQYHLYRQNYCGCIYSRKE